jgi:hypothetical protein
MNGRLWLTSTAKDRLCLLSMILAIATLCLVLTGCGYSESESVKSKPDNPQELSTLRDHRAIRVQSSASLSLNRTSTPHAMNG